MSILSFLFMFVNFISVPNLNSLETVYFAQYDCKTKNCMCNVKGDHSISLYEAGDEIITSKKIHTLYFESLSIQLNLNQVRHLENFIIKSKVYGNSIYWPFKISIISYYNTNLELSKKRALKARDIIKMKNPSASFNILLKKSIEKDRVDIVLHAENNSTTIIKSIPADYYLIDMSESMKDKLPNIRTAINLSIKPDSQIFVSMVYGCRNDQSFDAIIPQGPTEISFSYHMLLDKIESGKTLVVISDFNSSFPVTEKERKAIEQLGMKRNIEVHIIQ